MAAVAEAQAFVRELLGRSDYGIIGEIVQPRSRVLDLGCGDGELLAWLAVNKGVDARGVEINGSRVQRAIARGVSVYQGDIDEALADYPAQAFDYVILSQTLQETRSPLKVLREMLRVGRYAIVAFPNFGHWSVRLDHLFRGRAPKTDLFPHEWFDSPNIHFLTVHDFEDLAKSESWTVERRIFLSGKRRVQAFPNLLAEVAIFLVKKSELALGTNGASGLHNTGRHNSAELPTVRPHRVAEPSIQDATHSVHQPSSNNR